MNLPGEYVASVDLDEPTEDSCLQYRALRVRWELSAGGHVIERSGSELSYYFESQDGTFDIDLEVLSDPTCLNARNPRLVVALSPYGPSDTADQITSISILLGLSMLCAGAGIVLVIRSRSLSADERRRTPGLPIVGYAYALTWFVVLVPYWLLSTARQQPVGLPVSLVRLDAWISEKRLGV